MRPRPLSPQLNILRPEILHKLEEKKMSLDRLREMDASEIGHMVRHVQMGPRLKVCSYPSGGTDSVCSPPTTPPPPPSPPQEIVDSFPHLQLHATIQPITRTVLRVTLVIEPLFKWNMKVHGKTEPWWIWVEDAENEHIYHAELYQMHAEHVRSRDEAERNQTLTFTIPIFEPLPPQYIVRATSERWLSAGAATPISFKHLILPNQHPPHTELLDLQVGIHFNQLAQVRVLTPPPHAASAHHMPGRRQVGGALQIQPLQPRADAGVSHHLPHGQERAAGRTDWQRQDAGR